MDIVPKEIQKAVYNVPKGYVARIDGNKVIVEKKEQSPYINSDAVREDFMSEVYRILDADPTNDRANQIIDVFDKLPTIEITEPVQWKPTAAQMYALKKKVEENIYSGKDSELSSLLNDLAKLL
jgi:hypothetical protein